MSFKNNPKPKKLSISWYQRAAGVTSQVEAAGGCKGWDKISSPDLDLLWKPEIQRILREDNYQLKIFPENIIVMSPDFVKKEEIKNKMNKEFGN